MQDLVIKPSTIGGYIRCISGLFITRSNPKGLTPTEINFVNLSYNVLTKLNQQEFTKEVREELANSMNTKTQVVTNYINTLKKKGVVKENKLHPVFYKTKLTIEHVK